MEFRKLTDQDYLKMKKLQKYPSVFMAICAALAPLSTASAGVVTLLETNPYGTSWNNASYWSDGNVPSAANDYVVDGLTVRSPENDLAASGNVFPGSTLTLTNSGILSLKSNTTVDDLIIDGGILTNAKSPNALITFEGNVLITGTTQTLFRSYDFTADSTKIQTDSRSMKIRAKISGDANSSLLVEAAEIGKVWFLNSANDFAGTLTVGPDTQLWLYEAAGSTANVGALGADTVKLVTTVAAQVHTAESLTVGTWTTTYRSTSDLKTMLTPNSITVTNQWEKNALSIAGIDAPIGATITSVDSSRAPNTYYIASGASVDETNGWDNVSFWRTGSANGDAAKYIPTVGDTVRLTSAIRSSSQNDVEGYTEYMLAKFYLDAGGKIILKNKNSVLCFPDMIFNGGTMSQGKGDYTTARVDGHIYVQAATTLNVQNDRTLELRAILEDSPSGAANLLLNQDREENNGQYNTAVRPSLILTADNSGWSGKLVMDRSTWLQTTVDGALGSGGLTLNGDNQVQLGGVQSVKAVVIANNGTTNQNTLEISNGLTTDTLDITGQTTLIKGAGSLNVGKITIFPSAGYVKENFTANATFENGFSTNELQLRAANVVVSGGDVTIGSDERNTSLSVPYVNSAYNDAVSPQTFYKTALDLSGADSAAIKVKHFEIATISGGRDVAPQATVRLAPVSTVVADTLSMASSNNVGLRDQVNALYLGATETTLAIDAMYIAGGTYYNASENVQYGTKGEALLQATEGGKLTITNTAGSGGADLYIGAAPVSTGGGSDGTVDLRGVTDDSVMKFGTIELARKINEAGFSNATFSMNAGTVTADKMVLGVSGGSAGKVNATVNLEGGTLEVKQVYRGSNRGNETVNFNFKGGTLKVDEWGTEAIPMNLVQNGGILAPSGNRLSIYGDYIQNDGALKINLGRQIVTVFGNTDITKLVIDLENGDLFDDAILYEVMELENPDDIDLAALILEVTEALEGEDLEAVILDDMLVVGSVGAIANSLPEPASWALMIFGAVCAGLLRRPTRRKK